MIRLVPPKFRQDYELALNEPLRFRSIWRILTQASWLMIYFGRLGEARWAGLARFLFLLMSRRRGIEMKYSSRIGGGVVLGHAYGITVNSKVVIEGNCLLFKGSTLGDIRTGKRKGVPKLRRFVVVGLNATICGGVTIGNDVFIAPGAFVNFDVPDHSVVVGNPGVVHAKYGAVRGYFKDFE